MAAINSLSVAIFRSLPMRAACAVLLAAATLCSGRVLGADLYWTSGTGATSLLTCTDGQGSWQASTNTSQRWFNPLTGSTQFWGSGSSGSNSTVQIGVNNGAAANANNPITIGSTGGSNPPRVGAIVFAKAGSGGYVISAGGTATNLTNVLHINATGTSGVSSGTGILMNSDVVGDTTFNAIRSGTSGTLSVNLGETVTQTWTNNSSTYALVMNCGITGTAGGRNLITNGVGLVTLSGSNTFNNLTANSGTLRLTNASASGTGSLSVGSGATLNLLASLSKNVSNSGTIAIGAGGALTAGSIGSGALAMAGVTGTTASFTSTSGPTIAPASVTMAGNTLITLSSATSGILSTGAVAVSGTNNVLSVGGSVVTGTTYTLVSGSSLSTSGTISLTGAAVGNQTLALGTSGTIGRTTYSFASTSTALQLAVTGTVYDLFWNGGASGTWDYTTANWQKDGTGSNITFVLGDKATIGTASTIVVDSGTAASVQAAQISVTNAAGTVALSGSALSTTGTFGKSGAGALTIANASTFSTGAWVSGGSMTTSGSTIVTSGGLNVSGGSFTANAATTIAAGGLNVSGGVATLNAASSIAGGITVTGGTAALNAANTVTGSVSATGGGAISLGDVAGVGSGVIALDNGRLISTLSSGTIANTIAVGAGGGTAANASVFTLSGTVSGTSSLTAAGPGELVVANAFGVAATGLAVNVSSNAAARFTGPATKFLNGTGTISGTLTLDNATVVVKNGATVGGGGSIVLAGTTALSGTTGSGNTSTITAAISGAGGLSIGGASTRYVILGGSNSYSGGTQLSSDVGAGDSAAFGTGPVTATNSNARINNTAAGQISLANNLSTGAVATNVLAFTGANPIQITGTVTGSGILRASSNGIVDITQQSAATMQAIGSIDMGNGGVVRTSSGANFGSLSSILFSGTSGSTLMAMASTGTISQAVKIGATNNNPCNATFNTNGYDMTLSGLIQNLNSGTGGGLVKSGAGSLTLTNANTFTGPTSVSAGSLLVNGSLDPASAVTVASGAALGGSGTIGGSILFNSGANFAFDPLKTLTVNGATVSFGGFSIANVLGLGPSTPDGTYSLMAGSATFDLTNVSNVGIGSAASIGGGKTAYFQGGFQLVVVPEPSAITVVAIASVCIGLMCSRRRST